MKVHLFSKTNTNQTTNRKKFKLKKTKLINSIPNSLPMIQKMPIKLTLCLEHKEEI